MMVMLGAAYLQIARIDRRTSAAVDTRSNADEASILRYIGNILKGDVPEKLNGEIEFYDFPWTATQPGGAVPLTNNGQYTLNQRRTNGLWLVEDRYAPTVIPGPVPDFDAGDLAAREPRAGTPVVDAAGNYYAEGNHGDDPWLASNEPYGLAYPTVALRGYWPHITNLMGVYLDLNPSTMVFDGTNRYPLQYLSTANNNIDSGDTDVLLAVRTTNGAVDPFKFADADGDGIYDSRWTWAPLPSDGGLAYVMAVRIIDNSALADLNTWSYSRSTGATEPPRWLWPGELDLESTLDMIGNEAGFLTPALNAPNVLDERQVAANGSGIRTAYDRMYNWLDGSAVWKRLNKANDLDEWKYIGTDLEQKEVESGSTGVAGGEDTESAGPPNADFERFRERTNELELRWRFGLNRALPDNNGPENPTDLENVDSALFRSATLETAWDSNGTFANEPAFMFNEPRKLLSTVTGSADYARVNINEAAEFDVDNINDTDALDDLAEVFEDSIPNVPPLMTRGDWGNKNEFASQAAAVVRDFIDKDAKLTYRETDGGDGMYGMEFLPFISEVYLQARYTADVRLQADPPPAVPPVSGDDEVRWTHNAGDYAAAIELVNPWPWTIEMPEVELFVGGQSWGMLKDLLGGQATMTANEFVILRRLDGAGGDNSLVNAITGADTVPDSTILDWPVDAATADEVEIRLEAETNTPRAVVYQRFFVNDIASAVTDRYMDTTLVTTGIADGDAGYRQYTFLGTGNGINAMAVRDVDVEAIEYETPDNAGLLTTNNEIVENNPQPINSAPTNHSQFNTARKGAVSSASDAAPLGPESLDLDDRVKDAVGTTSADAVTPQEPWIIGNAGRMYRSGDILRAVFLGPRRNGANDITVADVWKEFYDRTSGPQQYEVANLMLDLSDTSVAFNAAGTSLNHAAYYLTAFTTLSVNDGKGGLIAGLPNINTMSERMLAQVLPTNTIAGPALPKPFDTTPFAEAIVEARQDPTFLGRAAGTKGIAFTAELKDYSGTPGLFYDAAGNTSGEVTDFNELDPGFGPEPMHSTDGYTDDIEEKTMFLNYLNQVVSTRSDIYTAYVLVRAYQADDFTNGTPADDTDDVINEFRLIAVFDRSEPGFPRILAVRRFSDP